MAGKNRKAEEAAEQERQKKDEADERERMKKINEKVRDDADWRRSNG